MSRDKNPYKIAPKADMGGSGAPFGRSLGRSEALLGRFGRPLGHFGVPLGRFLDILNSTFSQHWSKMKLGSPGVDEHQEHKLPRVLKRGYKILVCVFPQF